LASFSVQNDASGQYMNINSTSVTMGPSFGVAISTATGSMLWKNVKNSASNPIVFSYLKSNNGSGPVMQDTYTDFPQLWITICPPYMVWCTIQSTLYGSYLDVNSTGGVLLSTNITDHAKWILQGVTFGAYQYFALCNYQYQNLYLRADPDGHVIDTQPYNASNTAKQKQFLWLPDEYVTLTFTGVGYYVWTYVDTSGVLRGAPAEPAVNNFAFLGIQRKTDHYAFIGPFGGYLQQVGTSLVVNYTIVWPGQTNSYYSYYIPGFKV